MGKKICIDGILCNFMCAEADAADVVVAAQAAKLPTCERNAFAKTYWMSRYGAEEGRLSSYIQAVRELSIIWHQDTMDKVRSAFGQLDEYRGERARAEANRQQSEAVVELVGGICGTRFGEPQPPYAKHTASPAVACERSLQPSLVPFVVRVSPEGSS